MLTTRHIHYAAKIEQQQNSVNDEPQVKTEGLPFAIRAVSSSGDLKKAIQMRHSAYMRHVPGFAESLSVAESADIEDGVVVMLAESKLDGSCVGTMRIQTNDFGPLSLEKSVILPPHLRNRRLAEATRLGVTQERGGRIVTAAMFKAFYLYCKENDIDSMVITARSPVDRQYDRLMFKDVYPELGYIPFEHVGNMLHRVMCLEVDAVHALWGDAQHPLFNFFFNTVHKDIDVSGNTGCKAVRLSENRSDQIELMTA